MSTPWSHANALAGLLLGLSADNAKDNRDACIESDALDTVGSGITYQDVMTGFAFMMQPKQIRAS